MIPKKISAVTALVIISVLFFTGCKDKANTSSASSGTVSSKPSVSSDETPINSDSPPASDTSSVSSKPHNDASSQPHLHAYKITVVPPTCTEDGYTGDEVCTVCGEIVKEGQVIPAHCPSKAFADLNTDRWYHEYTDYVIARELMNGMDETHFAPEGNLTRGQLVTTLYRLAGEPEVAEPATFSDVKAGRYYTEAVAWGEDLGIVKGMTDDTFSPEGTVTREQAATFLYRYVTNYLKQEPGQGADLKAFADGGKVQDYAKTAMSWAVAEGFFEGYGDGTLRPGAVLTRAQMAKLLTILDRDF